MSDLTPWTPDTIAKAVEAHHWPPPTYWIRDMLTGIVSAWEADRNRLEQQEAEAQDKAHPQIRPMTQLENAYMDLEGKLGQANAHIEALEKEAATLHAALMVFEAGWSTGGYLDPLDFWDKCFKRLNDLVPPDHRSFVWAVEQEMRDRAPLRGEEEK